MSDTTELVLDMADRNSTAWLKIRTHLEARLAEHRRMNDNDLTPEKTATLRGRIKEIQHLLAAGDSQDQHQ